MTKLNYQLIHPGDKVNIEQIAHWYLSEWNIPLQTSVERIQKLEPGNFEFQVLMTLNDLPVATGGLYNQVGILDKVPHLKIYKNWLALVYAKPELRGKGLGAQLCRHIQDRSKNLGIKNIYLFTHTAENFYQRLGWEEQERHALGGKNIAVMKKEL